MTSVVTTMPTIDVHPEYATHARQGRDTARYNSSGGRIGAGCVPLRRVGEDVEVLLVGSSAEGGNMWTLPKGGWEHDEDNVAAAARRECWEEGGVQGDIVQDLGKFSYTSKSGVVCDAFMFVLVVRQESEDWPEKHLRRRRWFKIQEAPEACKHRWMQEAMKAVNLQSVPLGGTATTA